MDRERERTLRSGVPSVSCRSCGSHRLHPFLDLGTTPLADALVRRERLGEREDRFPLEVAFCPECSLVQILEEVPPERLFVDNYLYFSSFSDDLLTHAREYVDWVTESRNLDSTSLVVELASNDGYLLKNFKERGIPVLGIDPAPDQAEAANAAGVYTIAEFFGASVAKRLRREGCVADVITANNVLAHVPDVNGFVEGMATLLSADGIITVENPYVRELIDRCEFDTIYHEHYCYFSCVSIDQLMQRHGLWLNHVESFPNLHGGTLRWHIGHQEDRSDTVVRYLAGEREAGLDRVEYYSNFANAVRRVRDDLLELLISLKTAGRSVAGYGAAAKGSTLLNYIGIGTDLVEYVVDRNVHKHGTYMPGTNQPVLAPEVLLERRPDFVLVLAWNFADEIMRQQRRYLDDGGKFILPIPTPVVIGE